MIIDFVYRCFQRKMAGDKGIVRSRVTQLMIIVRILIFLEDCSRVCLVPLQGLKQYFYCNLRFFAPFSVSSLLLKFVNSRFFRIFGAAVNP